MNQRKIYLRPHQQNLYFMISADGTVRVGLWTVSVSGIRFLCFDGGKIRENPEEKDHVYAFGVQLHN
jgi:hypothetical protein